MNPQTPKTKDKLDLLLERCERERKEFENHFLWKALGVSPQAFFAHVRQSLQASGIDERVWQARLDKAKKEIETGVRERSGTYRAVDFKNMRGLRA